MRGCEPGAAARPGYLERSALGDRYARCPKAWYRDNAPGELFEDYTRAKAGLLPCAGGALEQPAKFLEALDLIDRARAAAKAEAQAREAAIARLREQLGGEGR